LSPSERMLELSDSCGKYFTELSGRVFRKLVCPPQALDDIASRLIRSGPRVCV
jgi:hypothetical protein